jgi:hypothetical protein
LKNSILEPIPVRALRRNYSRIEEFNPGADPRAGVAP